MGWPCRVSIPSENLGDALRPTAPSLNPGRLLGIDTRANDAHRHWRARRKSDTDSPGPWPVPASAKLLDVRSSWCRHRIDSRDASVHWTLRPGAGPNPSMRNSFGATRVPLDGSVACDERGIAPGVLVESERSSSARSAATESRPPTNAQPPPESAARAGLGALITGRRGRPPLRGGRPSGRRPPSRPQTHGLPPPIASSSPSAHR